MRRALRRLRATSRDELRFRADGIVRRQVQRLNAAVRGLRWDRRQIAGALAEAVRSEVREAVQRADWPAVETRLRSRMRDRRSAFLLDPRTCRTLRRRIAAHWPDAAARAAADADMLVAGRFPLLGFAGLSFARDGTALDWHYDPVHDRRMPRGFWADVPYLDRQYGDHKIIWELNRHQHFLPLGRAYWLTGEARYARAITDHVGSWLEANPPLVGVNWASALELGLRSISWVWAMHFLLGDAGAATERTDQDGGPTWCLDMLLGLDRQLVHVEQNLSYYFSPNTHLTGEALALYVAGTALPELRLSGRWRDLGRRILLQEIDRQICADGGHAERSTHYHRYTLDMYLCALLTAEQGGDAEAASRFRAAVAGLATFMQALAGDDGWMPLIGDDDGGMLWPIAGRDPRDVRDSLALARAVVPDAPLRGWPPVEELLWIAGGATLDTAAIPSGGAPRIASGGVEAQSFPDTGYVVVRTGDGDHLTFDVGPHGYLNGGHAHADALSITVTAAGRPLLIDPGTATYTMDPALRDRMRHSASHNTLTLNGRSSAVPRGPFHWQSRADARLHACRAAHGFAHVEASHDGYGPVSHRRSILLAAGDGWLIVDEIVGGAAHAAELHWLFDPAWDVSDERGGRLLAAAGGARMWLLHDGGSVTLAHGDREGHLGWCSPRYGVVLPTWAARLSRPVTAPAALATWIGVAEAGAPPSLDRPPLTADSHARAVAVRVRHRERTMVALLRPQDAILRGTRSTESADYHTDARVLQYVMGAGALTVSLADGTRALALHDGLISLSAPEPLDAVHLAASRDRLELWCPAPPAVLHLHGRALREIRLVVLNGRRRPAAPRAGTDALTCHGSDWGNSHARGEGSMHVTAAPAIVTRASDRRAHAAG